MFRTSFLAALTLLAASPTLPAAEPPARSYAAIEQVGWTYGDEAYPGGTTRLVRFTHDGGTSSLGESEATRIVGELAAASLARPGEAVAFTLARQAGSLACTGRVESRGRAAGTCRFDPDQGFAAELGRRGIVPEDSDEMMALALVGARLDMVDGLQGLGYRFGDAGDLVAVAALGVTPAFAGELRDAGLALDDLDNLVAARAIGLDAGWLGEMARAGYPDLTIDQAIQMRAVGITPDYARRMSRVLSALGEIQ